MLDPATRRPLELTRAPLPDARPPAAGAGARTLDLPYTEWGLQRWKSYDPVNDGDYDYVVTTPTYHQDDPAADTAPQQREWISRAGSIQHVAGAGLVDVWKVTGLLDPLSCAPEVPAATG